LAVHQYDCFDITKPTCIKGRYIFHEECIGDTFKTEDNRTFDTLKNQFLKNNDQNKRLVVKMDVEGAEWDSLFVTPEEILDNIDQLVVEFHIDSHMRWNAYIQVMQKLKRTFYIANVHLNNCCCVEKILPFPTPIFEILFVNKRIGIINEVELKPVLPNPLDSPNLPNVADCQARW
jgi:hypothetical protein